MASEINDAIGTADLAAIDQWHAQLTRNIKGLMAAARAEITNEEGIGKPVKTYLLAEVIRGHPAIREALADLLAALIVEIGAEGASHVG